MTEHDSEVTYSLGGIEKTVDFISIQGSIGAGKSTLLKSIRRYLVENRLSATEESHLRREDAVEQDFFLVVDEPLAEWSTPKYSDENGEKISLLNAFYRNPQKLGFAFQVNAFTSRLRNLRDTLRRLPHHEPPLRIHIISERSLATDRLFFRTVCESQSVPETKMELDIYESFHSLICDEINGRENVMVYLPVTVPVCQQRIQERARSDETESGIPDDYLRRLDSNHRAMVEQFHGKVIQLDRFEETLPQTEIDAIVERLMHDLRWRSRV